RSTTATAFWDALATYSVPPSGLTATALGELPSTGVRSGPRMPTCRVCVTWSVAVSIADTVSLFAQVTYRRSPLGLRAMPVGCRPTSIVLTTALVAVSTTETVPVVGMPVRGSTTIGNIPSVTSVGPGTRPPQLLTYTFEPSAEMTVV